MALIHTPKLKKEPDGDSSPRRRLTKDCKTLLASLPEGLYPIDWYGVLPKFKIKGDYDHDYDIMEIRVQNKINFSRILQMRKPYMVKKISVCNGDLNCIDLWTEDQITQLSSRLADMINQTYYL